MLTGPCEGKVKHHTISEIARRAFVTNKQSFVGNTFASNTHRDSGVCSHLCAGLVED